MEHEDEDARALEAALAFLDDWAKLDEASEATSGSCDGEGASPAGEVSPEPKKSATKPRRRSTADKRKDEIRQLREQFKSLQEKMEKAQRVKDWQKRARACAIAMPGRNSTRKEEIATTWKEVAARQNRLRTATEDENVRLRSVVTEQRKTISSIRALLRRHASKKYVVQVTPKITLSFPVAVGSKGDNCTLDTICRQMEAVHFSKMKGDLAAVCGDRQLLPGKQIVQVSPTKIIALIHYTWMLPFEFSQIASVVVGVVKDSSASSSKLIQKESTKRNTMFHDYMIDHEHAGFSYRLCGSSAMRRRHEAGHIAFVFTGCFQPFLINGSPVSGITLSNRGVTSLTRPAIDSDLCQVDIVEQVEIEMSAGAEAMVKAQAKGLAEAIVESDHNQFTSCVGRIETAVIRQINTSDAHHFITG